MLVEIAKIGNYTTTDNFSCSKICKEENFAYLCTGNNKNREY